MNPWIQAVLIIACVVQAVFWVIQLIESDTRKKWGPVIYWHTAKWIYRTYLSPVARIRRKREKLERKRNRIIQVADDKRTIELEKARIDKVQTEIAELAFIEPEGFLKHGRD